MSLEDRGDLVMKEPDTQIMLEAGAQGEGKQLGLMEDTTSNFTNLFTSYRLRVRRSRLWLSRLGRPIP